MLLPHLPQRGRVVLSPPALEKQDSGRALTATTTTGTGKVGPAWLLPSQGMDFGGRFGVEAAGNKHSVSAGP